jgi:hypothetical protein
MTQLAFSLKPTASGGKTAGAKRGAKTPSPAQAQANRYIADNLEAARIILADPNKYGGIDSACQWADATLQQSGGGDSAT